MESLKKIISIIILVIMLPILFVNLVILGDSVFHPDEVPGFFSYKPFIVLSGSMEDEIGAGDLVLTKEIDPNEIKELDIISFRENELVVTHRVVNIIEENGEKRFVTKGDNNDKVDAGSVAADQVEGIYLRKFKGLGNVAMFIQTPVGIIVTLSIPLAVLICVQMAQNGSAKDENEKMKAEIKKLKKENEKLKK